jgi:uncharacterized protein
MRKITLLNQIQQIELVLKKCQYCHVAMVDQDNMPYVLPFNFGYHDGVVYLHSGPEGKKIDILKKNPNVCINFTADHELFRQHAEVACSYGMRYRSVIIHGKVEFINDYDKKIEALNRVMKQYVDGTFNYAPPSVNNVCVYKVAIDAFSGKIYGYETIE